MGEKLPKWPEKPSVVWHDSCFPFEAQATMRYERARAEAAIARLRLAMQHVYHHPGCAMMQRAEPCDCGYHEVLQAIGEIPA